MSQLAGGGVGGGIIIMLYMILLTGLLHCDRRLPIPKQKYSPEIKQINCRKKYINSERGHHLKRRPFLTHICLPDSQLNSL